jgi:hypothetical protein
MTDTTTTATRTFRTFELFDISWDRGSKWTAFDTADEAQAVIDGSPSSGEVVRRTWEVEVTADNEHLLQPGCGDRVESVYDDDEDMLAEAADYFADLRFERIREEG